MAHEIRNTIGDTNEEIDVTIPTTYRHEFEEMIIDTPVQKNSKEKLYKMLGI